MTDKATDEQVVGWKNNPATITDRTARIIIPMLIARIESDRSLKAEVEKLRVELEGRERERVYPDICTVCGGIIPIGCHEVHMRKHKMAQQQPVTERFVRYEYEPEICSVAFRYTRRKVGETVAVRNGTSWVVTYDGYFTMEYYDSSYQTLKGKGAFGELQ